MNAPIDKALTDALKVKMAAIVDDPERMAEINAKIDLAAKQVFPKLSPRELKQVDAAMGNLRLLHDSFETIETGRRMVNCKFIYPAIKRPLYSGDVNFVFDWARYHPRNWHVYIAFFCVDPFGKEFVDFAWFDRHIKYDVLEMLIDQAIADVKADANDKLINRVMWCATIGDKPLVAARQICTKAYGTYNPERPALRFSEDTII